METDRLSHPVLLQLQGREVDLRLNLEGWNNRLGELEIEHADLIAQCEDARRERSGLLRVLEVYGIPATGVDTEDADGV